MRLPTPVLSGRSAMVAGVLGYLLVALALLSLLVGTALPPEQRTQVATALGGQLPTLVLGGVLVAAGLVVLLLRGPGAYPAAARRLTGEVRLLLDAHPGHRLDTAGPPELRELAGAVNALADRRAAAEGDVARDIAAARADVEQERNRLAALMADLTVAVLVCSRGGRVLLYNAAARELLDDDPALGLGRSVFGLVDRDLVTHALDRVADGTVASHVSTVLRAGQLLRARVAPVRAGGQDVTGFVVVLEDAVQLQAGRRREALLRELSERTRAAAAGIRAATEALLDYPDMDAGQRVQFLAIIGEESQRLGEQVERWSTQTAELTGDGLLSEMAGEDLLEVLRRELDRAGLASSVQPPAAPLWLRVDTSALGRALVQLATRLRAHCAAERLSLSLSPAGPHAGLDLSWAGPVPDAARLGGWLDEPLDGGVAATVREVVQRHDAEVWARSAADGQAYLRLLLPLVDAPPRAAATTVAVGSRPEFYDFDLFDLPEQATGWQDRALAELAYTVFDTETTGFHPAHGDRIVSVGAVRVVGGRVLRHEVLERLVDPGRPIPETATVVHGIRDETVQGQPRLEQVLPLLARFAEDSVLVGHNVGFDMSFLRAAEPRTGVRFTQPVLDTLLLDAALFPDHPSHSLEAVAARLGVDVTGRHTALGDALVTGEVFVRLLGLLEQSGIATLGAAVEASRATYQARLDATLYGG